MSACPTIEVDVTFLSISEGGRQHPLYFGAYPGQYWPHLVVGDPKQRKAIVRDGNVLIEEYLGVTFLDGPEVIHPGDSFAAKLSLMYHPDVDYSAVVPGATFTIREGGQIVGFGRVTRRFSAE
jgi:translation elongation factor EF-Tu-like GTPase